MARGSSDERDAELLARIDQALALGKWSKSKPAAAHRSAPTAGDWKFTGRNGKAWTGSVSVESVAGEQNHFIARVTMGLTPR